MPPFGTILSSIALLIITTTSSGNHVASAFVNSSSFATKRTPPSIHQHLHIMMGKRQQQQRQNKGNKRNNKKKQSLENLLELETDLHDRGFKYVIGSDDSGGAGCIAGPVVVASCCVMQPYSSLFGNKPSDESTEFDIALPQSAIDALSKVNDCKILTPTQRQEIYDIIKQYPNVFAITTAERSAQQIDELNLLRATQLAFAESIETLVEQHELPYEECYAIVDGKISPKLYADQREEESDMLNHQAFAKRFSVRPYVNGDANVFVVALASIVARVTHNAKMAEFYESHPDYNFDENNGYGSKSHIDVLHRLGSLEGIHRMSFKQVAGR
eukprot:scaffold773_cov140-Skeletonema_marinoi.AAC.2